MSNVKKKEKIIESYLKNLSCYYASLSNLQRELDLLQDISPTTTSYRLKEHAFTSTISRPTETTALKRIDIEESIQKEIKRLTHLVTSIEKALEQFNAQELEFIRLRYFERLDTYNVTMELGFSEPKSMFRIRRHVLDRLLICLCHLTLY